MRHGWEWWESFWKWLLNSYVDLERLDDERGAELYVKTGKMIQDELKTRYKEFEEKWRTERKIEIPYPNQSSP